MNRRFIRTVVAGSTLLAVGAALAQEPAGSKQPKQQQAQSQDAQGQGSSSSSSATRAGASKAPVMLMLMVPVAVETKTNDTLADGCWAKLYDGYNYGGDSFTIVGPSDMADMTGPFGVDWEDKVSSIKTGPKATVTIYDNEDFRDRAASIKPGQEVPQITEKMGLFEEFNSMRIKCASS